jgi:hypothetical protein
MTRKVGDPNGSSENSGLTRPSSSPAVRVALLDLGPAHRQRLSVDPDRAEALPARLRGSEQVEVDLDRVHLLHAADALRRPHPGVAVKPFAFQPPSRRILVAWPAQGTARPGRDELASLLSADTAERRVAVS